MSNVRIFKTLETSNYDYEESSGITYHFRCPNILIGRDNKISEKVKAMSIDRLPDNSKIANTNEFSILHVKVPYSTAARQPERSLIRSSYGLP